MLGIHLLNPHVLLISIKASFSKSLSFQGKPRHLKQIMGLGCVSKKAGEYSLCICLLSDLPPKAACAESSHTGRNAANPDTPPAPGPALPSWQGSLSATCKGPSHHEGSWTRGSCLQVNPSLSLYPRALWDESPAHQHQVFISSTWMQDSTVNCLNDLSTLSSI